MGEVIDFLTHLKKVNPNLEIEIEKNKFDKQNIDLLSNRNNFFFAGMQNGLKPLEKVLMVSINIFDVLEISKIEKQYHGDTLRDRNPISDFLSQRYYELGFIFGRFTLPCTPFVFYAYYFFN